jgi:hypothetical protein
MFYLNARLFALRMEILLHSPSGSTRPQIPYSPAAAIIYSLFYWQPFFLKDYAPKNGVFTAIYKQ